MPEHTDIVDLAETELTDDPVSQRVRQLSAELGVLLTEAQAARAARYGGDGAQDTSTEPAELAVGVDRPAEPTRSADPAVGSADLDAQQRSGSRAVCAWNHFENIPTFYNWNNRPR